MMGDGLPGLQQAASELVTAFAFFAIVVLTGIAVALIYARWDRPRDWLPRTLVAMLAGTIAFGLCWIGLMTRPL